MRKTKIKFDKPIYLGFSILDLSKTLMTDFVYKYLKPTYGDRATICYTDTDSIICTVETPDIYKDMNEHGRQWFDTSNYPSDHLSGIEVGLNSKDLGMFKDECAGSPMTEFVGLRPKMYAFKVGTRETKRAKGVKKNIVKNEMNFADYKTCLDMHRVSYRTMNMIRSRDHQIYTLECRKKALSADDYKRYILSDVISTLAHGHYRIEINEQHTRE
ncbi:Hypothetical predicted protein [Mytilus galloprovincialis]|uniref:DNA-directed DNA polymerase n=1 Tax=Mytilus galloprovincialis TaxID=29158 RepID=A0A8B6BMA0_MYTGA|nr:Hypothetical predicted protein [Mytilus galloprovincialis]